MQKKMTNSHFDVVSRNEDGSISIRKAPRWRQNGVGGTSTPKKKNNATLGKLGPKSEISEGMVVLEIPLRTQSEANCFEHWRLKHERHKKQQAKVALALKPIRSSIQLPCEILFIRYAPKMLDKHDNLPMSFKYIVDSVCAILTGEYKAGKADSDERISIAYSQELSKEYSIRIVISPSLPSSSKV